MFVFVSFYITQYSWPSDNQLIEIHFHYINPPENKRLREYIRIMQFGSITPSLSFFYIVCIHFRTRRTTIWTMLLLAMSLTLAMRFIWFRVYYSRRQVVVLYTDGLLLHITWLISTLMFIQPPQNGISFLHCVEIMPILVCTSAVFVSKREFYIFVPINYLCSTRVLIEV